MARGEKVNFVVSSQGSEELLGVIFAPMNVYVRVSYRINQTIPNIKSEPTQVNFVKVSGGIEFNNIILEDLIPANAYIRAIEFTYTESGTAFFQLNLVENGGANMIIFEEQGMLFFEKLRIVAGGI